MQAPGASPRPTDSLTISELAEHDFEALDGLFREGHVPRFDDIEGDTHGTILCHAPDGSRVVKLLGDLAFDSPLARWCGKRFETPFSETESGRGINRFDNRFLRERYRFETHIEPSLFDDAPCLVVAYPKLSPLAGTRDELRSVDEGLMLGRGYYAFPWQDRARVTSFFALEV